MIKDLTTDTFNKEVLSNPQPSIVEVFTDSCPNCTRLEPIYQQTAADNLDNFSFFKLNANQDLAIAKRYKVLGVPTLLLFIHGKLVDKKVGVISQSKIEKRLEIISSYSEEDTKKKEVKGLFKLPWK